MAAKQWDNQPAGRDDETDFGNDGIGEFNGTADSQPSPWRYLVQPADVGLRLDKLASQKFTGFSRALLQKWIQAGDLLVNGQAVKANYAVKLSDALLLKACLVEPLPDLPENIAIDVLFEDETVLVINKPAGLVVHPGAGNRTGTLVNALLYHYPEQAHLPRAGLVHRIDKDTTGLLLIAKTAKAQQALILQLKDKSVYRRYQCVAAGTLDSIARHRIINAPIARHATCRTKMAIRPHGKPAITHIQSVTPLGSRYVLLDILLETGRTHQIRVHLSSVGHALVGDKVYTAPSSKQGLSPSQHECVNHFPRQALHAYQLGFVHPLSGQKIRITAPLPADMQALITALQ